MATKYYRDCKVVKTPTEEFEFFLRVDEDRKGNIVVSISPDGPADRAGLKNGDRIVEIDGKNVEKSTHTEVVQLIKRADNEIMFQVVDEEHDPNTPPPKTNGGANASASDLRPRLCHVQKKKNTLGFSIEAQGSDKPGHFISDVAEGGPAMEVGMRKGDRIIEVGGTNVEKMNHAKVVALIKKRGSKVSLLVADNATYQHFAKRKSKIKAKHASVSSVGGVVENPAPASKKSGKASKKSTKSPTKSTSSVPSSKEENARLIHVIKASGKGYGFFLRVRKDEKGEYIGDIKAATPAYICGLMENDRVLSVNGNGILTKSHEDVVESIKANSNHVVLMVAGPKAIETARNNGLLSMLRDVKNNIFEKPRQITISKGSSGFGFSLKMEGNKNSHVFSDIDEDSSAFREGLKNGDVLGGVNGESVIDKSHEDTVQKIKNSGDRVELAVATAATINILRELGVALTREFLDNWPKSDVFELPDFSKIDDFFKVVATAAVISAVVEKAAESSKNLVKCTLRKVDNAFGFFLRDDNGHFLGKIEENGAAELAGVKDNDQIIEVNGVNMEKETHDQVVEMIQKSGQEVVFLVLRKEEKEAGPSVKEETSVSLKSDSEKANEVEKPSPPLPRYCELERLPNGYGFNLNAEEGSRPGQYMKKIVAGGAASIAGVREGDRVVEINDIKINDKTHDDIVGIIKASGSKFTILVVDEEADLYYKNENIEITRALITGEEPPIPFFEQRNQEDGSLVYKEVLDEMAILSTAADAHSNASSVVETAATVHVDPEENADKSTPPIIVIPPPPSYEEHEEKEEEVAELIEEAINEIREDREAELEELAAEIKQEAVEEIKEDLREEFQEEIREAVQEEIREEIVEDVKEEIKEEVMEQVKEEIMDELREEAREEAIEDIREEIMDDLREEAREEAIEEIREEVIDDVREKVADGIKGAVAVAVVNEIREAVEDEREEEEIRETPEQMRERIEKEMREKLEKEMKERMEEELRQKIAAEVAAAAAPPPPAPEPPQSVPVSVIANSFGREIRPTSSVKKTAQSFVPKVDTAVKAEDINRIARNLRSVKKDNKVLNEIKEDRVEDQKEEKKEPTFKPAFMSAKAMFEGGGQQQSGPKPSWKRASNTSVKQAGAYGAPTPNVNGTDKPVIGRQTSWNKGGMSFKIVETSSAFN